MKKNNEEMISNYSEKDIELFKDWINLDLEKVTWQGRFELDFLNLWESLFVKEQSFNEIIVKFNLVFSYSTEGPVKTWFKWLLDKFIIYSFINKNMTINVISQLSNNSIGIIANTLRHYFVSKWPEHEISFSEIFQVNSIIDKNINIKYDNLFIEYDIKYSDVTLVEDEIMTKLDITLYPEWNEIAKKISKKTSLPEVKVKKDNTSYFKTIKEIVMVLIIGGVFIVSVKTINQKWESDLLEKISIYEPQFDWLNKKLVFKDLALQKSKKEFDLNESDIENLENKFNIEKSNELLNHETESEVELTSLDSVPKNFQFVVEEKSEYEEEKKKGYRDSRYGGTIVYRIVLNSIDTPDTKSKISSLIKKYGALKVDNVRPGQKVPGGVYYNMYLKKEYVSEFIKQVQGFGEATLYRSRTRSSRSPKGTDKVFIWVKKI